MSSPLSNFVNVITPVGTSTPLLPAGNYYIESLMLSVPIIQTVAAGAAGANLFLCNSAITRVYAFWQLACIGTGAGSNIVVNGVLSLNPKLVCVRGDDLIFFNTSALNVSAFSFGCNLYGATLP